ncbi:MAG: anhydro-N-acetylmuramic acid kinase [Bacteroidales bacterium]|jgi:anhydro-N-acetylmuramic acid kinase|nr:anhydro-N-acetylmuramic acid kinase [Bacteroidales bacterium]
MLYKVIGIMSGTSLDGLDLAYCHFKYENNVWTYSIEKAKTIEYSLQIRNMLIQAENTSALNFVEIDVLYGKFIGNKVKEFIDEYKLKVDFISSHGHTIFHNPKNKITKQIGSIFEISAITNITTIGDFRSMDVALNGQGAPLVPIGDRLLFSKYPSCLNLGGFSNISFEENFKRIAYDICPVNIVLNSLSQKLGMAYDKDGELAQRGNINYSLLEELSKLEYYKIKDKKSLSREWVEKYINPIMDLYDITINDKLSTFTEHISIELSRNIKTDCLITGGGAFNKFLISKLKEKLPFNILIPDNTTINYKEALIFAFLGVLRIRKQINVLSSVTGANKDSSSGVVVIV